MRMPLIGLGTGPLRGEVAERTIPEALAMGYRHLDTAQMYGNELEVGKGLRVSGVARDQVFLVTKVHQDRFADGTALDSAKASCERLGVEAADLILCHWPPRTVAVEAVADTLAAIRDAGLASAVGISNFNVSQMRAAAARTPVLTNQVEFHPLIDQTRLKAAADALGIGLTAYMPLARGRLLDQPALQRVATRLGRTPGQVALRWIVQQGVAAIPGSTRTVNLKANLAVLDFSLSDADMAEMTAMTAANQRFCRVADWEPDWDG